MTALERAAEAARRADLDWNPNDGTWHEHVARAVLMAVREEGDINDGLGDVYRAGFEAMFDAKFKDEYPMMSCGWEAMIDAILNEKDKTND